VPPRKRPVKPAAPVRPADKLAAYLRNRNFDEAVPLAEQMAKADPAHVPLAREAMLKAAEHYERAGRFDALQAVLRQATALPDDPTTRRRLAELLAMAGRRAEADALDPQPTHALHFADYLLRSKSAAEVPPEWTPAYNAVLDAFALYSNAKDDAARETLNAVGLSSPFLEWKLLLRGLMAWSGNDDARAVENFTRLNPARYPARLAAPVRVQCDAAFAQAQPDAVRSALLEQNQRLRSVGILAKLSKIRSELASSRKLGPAFKAAEGAVNDLKKHAPHLIPRLADAFYFAIARRGEQDDLPKYRKLFGPPPADPQFHKLEAMVFEEMDALEMSLARWSAYEVWLAGRPAGWTQPLADRARAVILHRMAGLAADIADDAGDPFGGFFGSPARKSKGKKPRLDPIAYWKQAADLAPDWEPPAQELFNAAVDRGDSAAAEAAARRYLTNNPQSVATLSALASLLGKQGRTADALELRRRALAVNPLDTANRQLAGLAMMAHARRQAVDGDLPDAEKLLHENKSLLEAVMPTSYFALRSVIDQKTKRPAEATTAADAARAQKGSRLVARLYLHANALLLKLKPKERAAAAKDLADALEATPTPAEAANLLTGYAMYLDEGLKYTGQKTQEKKFAEVAVRATESVEGSEVEFETLAALLLDKGHSAAGLKAATALMKRFPKNPVFPLVLAQAELTKAKGRVGYRVTEPLRKAKALAEASGEERHKQLLRQIEALLRANDPFSGLFGGGFFG
jgi:tetratricopeptide (TPR) repeat protein